MTADVAAAQEAQGSPVGRVPVGIALASTDAGGGLVFRHACAMGLEGIELKWPAKLIGPARRSSCGTASPTCMPCMGR